MLHEAFGPNAITDTAHTILAGTCVYPPDFDQATREICKECVCICMMILQDSVSIHISNEDWQRQWKGRQESTLSLELGLHFGHYIVGTQFEHTSHFHALKATLVMKRGTVLNCWARGLLVMLEKIFGCALITELRSILLMEEYFNASNKIIIRQRMIYKEREYKLILEEIYSKKNRLADDGTLTKVVFYNIVC
jgi:hypothetical protein